MRLDIRPPWWVLLSLGRMFHVIPCTYTEFTELQHRHIRFEAEIKHSTLFRSLLFAKYLTGRSELDWRWAPKLWTPPGDEGEGGHVGVQQEHVAPFHDQTQTRTPAMQNFLTDLASGMGRVCKPIWQRAECNATYLRICDDFEDLLWLFPLLDILVSHLKVVDILFFRVFWVAENIHSSLQRLVVLVQNKLTNVWKLWC